ncbi:MAG: hypothetical protein HZC12_04550 [Nitrospirae bacterium]|nr:hypothetical protein [Nitrospirota bacterium]
MRKKQLLFVTYHDESFDEGLSYALDLARTMNDTITILMIYKRKAMERFEDTMVAVAFAEANEHKTAREMIKEDYERKNEDYERKVSELKARCTQAGIAADVNFSAADVLSAVRNFLRHNSGLDMVLLSPSITSDGHITSKELNRLVKTASRPIVTMAKNAHVA